MTAKPALLIVAALFGQQMIVSPAPAQQNAQLTKPSTAPAAQPETKPARLSAPDILKKMLRTYADCKSYRDEGEVTIVFSHAAGKMTDRRPFKTSFVRPKLFRFEFKSRSGPGFGPWQRYVVWADGTKIRSWWTIRPQVEEFASMDMALGGPTGVSGGSAATIPSLLFPDMMWGSVLKQLTDAKLLGTEKVSDADCYKVEAAWLGTRHRDRTLWIDTRTFLVRKIFEAEKFPDFSTEQTTVYKPLINIDIPADEFEFEPPGE